MKYNKKDYISPRFEIIKLMPSVILENSGEVETGMAKENSTLWEDDSFGDLWEDDLWDNESEQEQ